MRQDKLLYLLFYFICIFGLEMYLDVSPLSARIN